MMRIVRFHVLKGHFVKVCNKRKKSKKKKDELFHWGSVVYLIGVERYLVIVCVSWCVRLCTILIFLSVERVLKRLVYMDIIG